METGNFEFERVPPSAEEFFRLFEESMRMAFKWSSPVPLRSLVHIFMVDGDMRARGVPGAREAHALIEMALRNPSIAAASFIHETHDAIEGLYYTRESPTRVIRIPIVGNGTDRALGETVRDATLN